jgi:hypothetical protein
MVVSGYRDIPRRNVSSASISAWFVTLSVADVHHIRVNCYVLYTCGLFNDSSSDCVVLNGCMINERWILKDLEGTFLACFKVLSRRSLWRTEENHEEHQNCQCPDVDSNRASREQNRLNQLARNYFVYKKLKQRTFRVQRTGGGVQFSFPPTPPPKNGSTPGLY